MTETGQLNAVLRGESGGCIVAGDCRQVMKDIEDGSVDMVLADPPYGTTACKWDSIIPLEPMWEQLKRIQGLGRNYEDDMKAKPRKWWVVEWDDGDALTEGIYDGIYLYPRKKDAEEERRRNPRVVRRKLRVRATTLLTTALVLALLLMGGAM